MKLARRLSLTALGLLLVPSTVPAEEGVVATFSIVARDPETGAMGCAVQSRYFAVGAVVPWGEADVGVIATQANVNVGYGPQGVALLREGLTADEVLERLLAEDTFPGKDGRQVAIVDAKGNLAVFTGSEAADWAGHKRGQNYSAQGNILAGPEVVDQMAEAFENSTGSLAERLLAALEGGQAGGGDRRGRQSAALLVVEKGGGRNTNNDVAVRLHVDDHPMPILELRRLLNIQLSMSAMSESRRLAREKDKKGALAAAQRAVELWPDGPNTHLNLGLLAYSAGDKETALSELMIGAALNPYFCAQLKATIMWTEHEGLEDSFMEKLCH